MSTALITAIAALVTAFGIAIPAIILAIHGTRKATTALQHSKFTRTLLADHRTGDDHPAEPVWEDNPEPRKP